MATQPSPSSDDNLQAFQDALNAGILDLRGRPGRYYVNIPRSPRPIATLTMPPGARILGDGVDVTTIVFRGDPEDHDWAGIHLGDDYGIHDMSFAVEEQTGRWIEQCHLIEIVGPHRGGEMSHCSLDHPVVIGPKRGDCIRFRGYIDKRITDQHMHHLEFRRAARSGIAIYGGVYESQFHHLTFRDTRDQDLDCETAVASGVEFEWHDCVHLLGPSARSSLAVSLYPGSVHMHHNLLDGRSLDIMGGSHALNNNRIWLRTPSGEAAVSVHKEGQAQFRNEQWVRGEAAGPGAVFVAAERLTAPSHVMLEDVEIVQNTPALSIGIFGVAGAELRGVRVIDQGALTARDAIRIEGTKLTRTTPVVVSDCVFEGTFRSAVSVSGAYLGGVGSIEIRDCLAPGAATILRQENVEMTATNGGISGPVTVEDCSPVA